MMVLLAGWMLSYGAVAFVAGIANNPPIVVPSHLRHVNVGCGCALCCSLNPILFKSHPINSYRSSCHGKYISISLSHNTTTITMVIPLSATLPRTQSTHPPTSYVGDDDGKAGRASTNIRTTTRIGDIVFKHWRSQAIAHHIHQLYSTYSCWDRMVSCCWCCWCGILVGGMTCDYSVVRWIYKLLRVIVTELMEDAAKTFCSLSGWIKYI